MVREEKTRPETSSGFTGCLMKEKDKDIRCRKPLVKDVSGTSLPSLVSGTARWPMATQEKLERREVHGRL